jgi:hypothetical protein
MASRLSLDTRIRCQSLRLRRPLRALEIDSLRGQAGGPSCQEAKLRAARICTSDKLNYLFDVDKTNISLTSFRNCDS